MEKLTTKILSLILTLSMVFSLAVPAFAAEDYSSSESSINSQEDIEAAREAYAALTPDAKAIFDASLANDPDMLQFHTTYVDQNFTPPAPKPQTRSVVAIADPMQVLMAQLSGLGLPSAVLYSLKAMGASMVAAIADGPLPVGDILLAAATASAVVVIAANWKTVSPQWSKIVAAFKKAFADFANNIISAFNSLKSSINTEVKAQFDKSAEEAINGLDSNKQNHILNNKLHNHGWNKLFNGKDPRWNQLAPILVKVLKDGAETVYNNSQGVYERTLAYKGYDVVVRFIKAVNGTVTGISTAYLK